MDAAVNHNPKGGTVLIQNSSVKGEVIKAGPPVTVAFWEALTSIPVDQWIKWMTLVYIACQIVCLFWDRRRARK